MSIVNMTTISELRVCKSCGNVFSKRAGATIIIECPQCKGVNFETITPEESEEEKMYLNDID
jgi:phage FluMu protein Com